MKPHQQDKKRPSGSQPCRDVEWRDEGEEQLVGESFLTFRVTARKTNPGSEMLFSYSYNILIQILSPPVHQYKPKSPHRRPEFRLTSFLISLVSYCCVMMNPLLGSLSSPSRRLQGQPCVDCLMAPIGRQSAIPLIVSQEKDRTVLLSSMCCSVIKSSRPHPYTEAF